MLSQILKIIAKGQQFQLHYFSAYYGAWCQAWFYVGKGQLNIGRLNEGKELFTSLDFNMVSVNPDVIGGDMNANSRKSNHKRLSIADELCG